MSPTKATQQFKAWSYSRKSDYDACPRRAKYKYLDKLPEPPAPALERGSAIHKLAERYETGQIKFLPVELKLFKEEFKALRKIRRRLMVEQQIGLDARWAQTDWFGSDCWCRVVLDLMYDDDGIRNVVDWKTGKVRQESRDQMELYAIAAFAAGDKTLERVDTKLAYLDQGEEICQTFVRSDLPALKKAWAKSVKKMLADTVFKPCPGNACRWCPYTKSKGGPCEY